MNGNASTMDAEQINPNELLLVITTAASQNPSELQGSEQRFRQMLNMHGFYNALYDIAVGKDVPLPVRQQAIIQFKNHGISHWKYRKMFTTDQKAAIRSKSLLLLDEVDDTIASCNTVIVSKIARSDYPSQWPELVRDLTGVIGQAMQRYSVPDSATPSDVKLRRSLQLLHGVLKEFSGYKMLLGVKTMTELVDLLREPLSTYYSMVSSGFDQLKISVERLQSCQLSEDVTVAHLLFKCLAKAGFWQWQRSGRLGDEHTTTSPWIITLFQQSVSQFRSLVELRYHFVTFPLLENPNTLRTLALLTKHILHFGKFFRKLSSFSHTRFVELPLCSDLIMFYWQQVVQATDDKDKLISDNYTAIYHTRLLVQGMVLFKDNLNQWVPIRRNGTVNPNPLPQDFVAQATKILITKFMPLSACDLEAWMNDPEEWFNAEEVGNDHHWEFELRSCSERLLMVLSRNFSGTITAILQEIFQESISQPLSSMPSIIRKEAMYCSLGRCCRDIKELLPFENLLNGQFIPEARTSNPRFAVLKRRIAWLIGKWVSEECASPNQPVIWELLLHLLKDEGSGGDLVVRLSGAVAVRECVDTLSLDADVLNPYLAPIITELLRLMSDAELMETKRRVDGVLNAVITQAGKRVVPCVSIITEPLPQLWTTAHDDWALKCSLLGTVTELINAIQDQSSGLAGIVVPLVKESLSQDCAIYLEEDGMKLWEAALRNTMTAQSVNGAQALLEIFPDAIRLLNSNLDLLGQIITIIESYFLLDGQQILTAWATELFRAFTTALQGSAVTPNIKDMIISLELLLQATPPNLWGEALHFSGLFAHVMKYLLDDEADMTLRTEYIYLLARIVIADKQIICQLMTATANGVGMNEGDLWEGLLDQWWTRFDNMSEPRHRKLCAMGIASLVSTGRVEVLKRMTTEIFNLWLDVFGEIKEATVEEPGIDASSSPVPSPYNLRRHWELDDAPSEWYKESEGTPEYERRKAVYDTDPVRTTPLNAYVSQCVAEARSHYPGKTFQEHFLANADPTVLQQIMTELEGH